VTDSSLFSRFDPMPAIQLWKAGCGTRRRPLAMDSARRREVQVEEEGDRQALTQSISEALQQQQEPLQEPPAAGPSTSQPYTVDDFLQAFSSRDPCDDDSEDEDDDVYSDDEDYSSEAMVFKSMCREGLID
jgi:hypothetical protein